MTAQPDSSAHSLKRIADALEKILARMAPNAPPPPPGEEVASDGDLNGQYGDPEIKKDPRDWSGPSYVGMRYSDAPAEYLDLLAGFLRWKAGKNDDDAAKETDAEKKKKLVKYAKYARTDAARARGWAHRKRSGWAKSEEAPSGGGWDTGGDVYSGDNEIPFASSAMVRGETVPRWERW